MCYIKILTYLITNSEKNSFVQQPAKITKSLSSAIAINWSTSCTTVANLLTLNKVPFPAFPPNNQTSQSGLRMDTRRWQEEGRTTKEDMVRLTERRFGHTGCWLEWCERYCQRSCQMETTRRPMFCSEREELSLSLSSCTTVTVTVNGLVKLLAFNAHISPSKCLVSFWN